MSKLICSFSQIYRILPNHINIILLSAPSPFRLGKLISNPESLPSHQDAKMKNVESVARIISKLVLPCLPQVLEVIDDDSRSKDTIIISSAFTRSLALLIAHRREGIPVILLHLQPLLPNSLFPSYRTDRELFVRRCVEVLDADGKSEIRAPAVSSRERFLESYWKIEHALEEYFLTDSKKAISRGVFGKASTMPRWTEIQTMLTGRHQSVTIVNAYSNYLIPKLEGSPGLEACNVYDIGSLAHNYLPLGQENLSDSLEKFLSASSEKPICIGFGSMPFRDVQVVLSAVKILQVRAVLVGDIFLHIPKDHPAIRYNRIICVSQAPYPKLLPRCLMMLCHGGIGVVQACLRAGIPCLISPLMGDQFALARLVETRKVGAQCGKLLSSLESHDIVKTVSSCFEIIETCQELGERIRSDPSPSALHKISEIIQSLSKGSA